MDVSTTPSTANTCFKQQFAVTAPLLWKEQPLGNFPSASLAWRMSEEKFIKDLNVFDDLKFRVGYGVSGNSLGFGAYSAIQTYSTSGWFNYTNANGTQNSYHTLAAASNANPDLNGNVQPC